MPDTYKYDPNHRPESYWDTADPIVAIVSNIKGNARKRAAHSLLQNGKFGELEELLIRESVEEEEKNALLLESSELAGGEFLPDYLPSEVEIARVVLDSMMGDIISIRARRSGNRIRYRIVDEHDWHIEPNTTESEFPLALGEMITMLETSDASALTEPYGPGLIDAVRDSNFCDGDCNPQELVGFVRVFSDFYPQLEAYYMDQAGEWLQRAQLIYENRLADEGRSAS